MHLKVGTLLQGGKYRIVRFIKNGGFGCTYEAQHTFFDVRVAVKEFFPKDFCNRDGDTLHVTVGTQSKTALVAKLKKKFIDEAVILYKLRHPGIVTVSDVFEENGTAYYVMDYIDGCSLDDIVKREGALAEAKALSYIRQVCAALDYVHSQNRLHLDIKPGNVMVDAQGRTVLIDFGTSKQYDEENGENTSTIMGMTPGYAPLEQYKRGGVQQFTPATDIYSLGATLYKLLTGSTPPDSNEIYEDGLPSLPSTISASSCSAVEKAMTPRRKDRPQSVGEFLAIFDETQKVEVVSMVENAGTLSDVSDESTVFVSGSSEEKHDRQIYYSGDMLMVKGIKYPMMRVGAGSFDMGEGVAMTSDRCHNVKLSTYSIGVFPVTQDIWEAVMGYNPSHFKGTRRPVEMVSWLDCREFIARLNEQTGQSFRMPTEAEWEFAARGGNSSCGYRYSGTDEIDDAAWYNSNSERQTSEVGLKLPNELGLYDMSGNVYEWCRDWYESYSGVAQINPKGAYHGTLRVCRGGSWSGSAWCCKTTYRNCNPPDFRCFFIGLRLCL